jgi:hypothetical protein
VPHQVRAIGAIHAKYTRSGVNMQDACVIHERVETDSGDEWSIV